jgi:DNA-binding response OmpR family regulator
MSTQSKRVLVLEDDLKYQYVLEFTLSNAGFGVTTAADVATALAIAKSQHFDLVIVDYYLPDHSGTHFIARLRRLDEHKDTPVILVTAWPDELNLEQQCKDLSALPLSKMCTMRQLVGVVSRCLADAGCTS